MNDEEWRDIEAKAIAASVDLTPSPKPSPAPTADESAQMMIRELKSDLQYQTTLASEFKMKYEDAFRELNLRKWFASQPETMQAKILEYVNCVAQDDGW